MAAFEPEADLSQDLAFRLLVNTSMTLFWRNSILIETTQWLNQSARYP